MSQQGSFFKNNIFYQAANVDKEIKEESKANNERVNIFREGAPFNNNDSNFNSKEANKIDIFG